jgi:hypothetical protein
MVMICKWVHVADGALVVEWARTEDTEARWSPGRNEALYAFDVAGHNAPCSTAHTSRRFAGQEHVMSLRYREQGQLRRIETGLLRSDHHLAAMLGMFGRLYAGQGMPAREQVPSRQGPVCRVAAWIVAASEVISVLLGTALVRVCFMRRAHARPSAARPDRTRPGREADDQQNPAG